MLTVLGLNSETRLSLEMNCTQVIIVHMLEVLLLCFEYKTRRFI